MQNIFLGILPSNIKIDYMYSKQRMYYDLAEKKSMVPSPYKNDLQSYRDAYGKDSTVLW